MDTLQGTPQHAGSQTTLDKGCAFQECNMVTWAGPCCGPEQFVSIAAAPAAAQPSCDGQVWSDLLVTWMRPTGTSDLPSWHACDLPLDRLAHSMRAFYLPLSFLGVATRHCCRFLWGHKISQAPGLLMSQGGRTVTRPCFAMLRRKVHQRPRPLAPDLASLLAVGAKPALAIAGKYLRPKMCWTPGHLPFSRASK